jgi:hypothetical protein
MAEFHLLFDARNGFTDRTITADDAVVQPDRTLAFADADGKVIAVIPPGAPLLLAERLGNPGEHRYVLRLWPDEPPKLGDDPVPNIGLAEFVEDVRNQVRAHLGDIACDVRPGEIQMSARVIAIVITTRVQMTEPVIKGLGHALRTWSISTTHWPWGWNIDRPDA